MTIPLRKLGKTEARVTMMGLGGEGVLRTHGYEKEAYDLFLKLDRRLKIEYIEKLYHVTYTTVSTDSSYWYIILDEKKKEGGTTSWHGTVELASPYFDFAEALKQFGSIADDSRCFFKTIEEVSKESIKTFNEYNRINKEK